MAKKKDRRGEARQSRRAFLLGGVGAGALILAPRALAEEEKKQGEGAGKEKKKRECPVTESNIEGPFYRGGAPMRTRLRGSEAGEVLVVSGRVEGYPGCVALKDALVDVWQADSAGSYDNDEAESDPRVFKLRGRMRTDEQGRYEFETILPGRYKIGPTEFRPAHIHYKVSCTGYAPLTTQLYFEGDPHIAKDRFVRRSLVMKLTRHASAEELKKRGLDKPFHTCVFDVVLRRREKSAYGAYGD